MTKILLVEDDKNAINLYKQILESGGYEVDVAEDGEAGLAKIKEGGHSLVLLDVMIPKMDGLTVLSALKKDPPKTPVGKIVLLTNLTHNPILEEAKDLGAQGHIDKASLNPDQFLEKVKALLQ